MRRKNNRPADNHDRWLVSYADFITLLFAFFVVMFATSHVNAKRVARISEVYSAYLTGKVPVPMDLPEIEEAPVEPISDEEARRLLTMEEMLPVKQRLETRLKSLIEDKQVSVRLSPRGLVVSLREAAFFDPGRAGFRIGASNLLTQVGGALKELPDQPIRLEGHTDDVPINTLKFPSNWELSTARAVEVLDLLLEQFEIPSERLSVAGYGEHRPIADNVSIEGRAANRRVDIVVLSQAAAAMAPRQRLQHLPPADPSLPVGEIKPSPFPEPAGPSDLPGPSPAID